jgi:hypothetical protein
MKMGMIITFIFFAAAEIACGLGDEVDISFGEMREFSSTHSPT